MALEMTLVAMVAFTYTVIVLIIFSGYDLRERRVPNELMLTGYIVGIMISLVTNLLFEQPVLHIVSIVFALLIASVLFKLKSIGGADAKTLVLIAIVSPGIEFTTYTDTVLEAIIGSLLPALIMLACGYLYSRRSPTEDSRTTPLIPFLLFGYLLLQVFALF